MGWKIWKQNGKKLPVLLLDYYAALRTLFQILTINFLSLLLPLSFLLLARLSTSHYLLASTTPTPKPFFPLHSLFLYKYPSLLHGLVSLVSVAAFINVLTGGRNRVIMPVSELPTDPGLRPRLCMSWLCLCMLHVCVGLGIEGTISAGIDGSGFGHERSSLLISRAVLFLGLHETMLYWSATVVKPVVDDTVLGFQREERWPWVERAVGAASFGALWLWRLRDEVVSMVVVPYVESELLIMGQLGVADLVGWWLYYLTVMTGMVRVVKDLIWVGMKLLSCSRRVQGNPGESPAMDEQV